MKLRCWSGIVGASIVTIMLVVCGIRGVEVVGVSGDGRLVVVMAMQN